MRDRGPQRGRSTPTGRVGDRRFETGGQPADERRPERRALGHTRNGHRQAGGVGDGPHPWIDARPAAGGHDASRGRTAELDESAHDEARRLVCGPPHCRAIMGEVESVEHATPVGVVQRRAFAPDVRRPHRYPPWVDCFWVALSHKAIHPAEEKAACIARSPDLALAHRGVRQCPQAGDLSVLADGDPHEQRRAAEHKDVAVAVSARDQLFAQRIDRPRGKHRVRLVDLADRRARHRGSRHPVHRGPAVGAYRVVPAETVEQREGRTRR